MSVYRTCSIVAATAGLLILAGCNGGNPQITGASVAGTVKYQGKIVTGGEIIFVSPTDPNKSQSGRIFGDGTFDVPNVPTGDVIVVIDTEQARYDVSAMHAKAKGGDGNIPKVETGHPPMKYMKIDKKYSQPTTSPLRLTVEKGTNQKDFDLE
jgi:hypothetical protein